MFRQDIEGRGESMRKVLRGDESLYNVGRDFLFVCLLVCDVPSLRILIYGNLLVSKMLAFCDFYSTQTFDEKYIFTGLSNWGTFV